MLRLLLRYALGTSLLLALPLWAIQPHPYNARAVGALLTPPEDCAAPCFMGIRPGDTHLSDALKMLDSHPWVANYRINYFLNDGTFGLGDIQWTWSEARPAAIDARFPGELNFHTIQRVTVVEAIEMHTTLPPPQVIEWLGVPAGGLLTSKEEHVTYGVLYRPQPYSAFIGVSASMRCPVNILDYWYSDSDVFMTSWEGIAGPYLSFTDAARVC